MLYNTANPHGGDIYDNPITLDFSANINPLGTPESVMQAMEKALREVIHYPDPYCRKLVRAIAGKESLPEKNVLCGNGAAELIYAFSQTVRPKKALEAAPTFSEYALSVERNGGRVFRYALKEEQGFEPDDSMASVIQEVKPDVVFLCNPNNPTGRFWDRQLLEKVLQVCETLGSRLFLDECFLDLSEGGESLKDLVPAHPKLFILKAFTKNYGMAGVRLGYCLSSDQELLTAMAGTAQPWNVSLIAQEAGIAALKEKAHIEKAVILIDKERKYLTESLIEEGFRVIPSDVNFLLFKDALKREEPLDQALKKQGIAVRNCSNFPGLSDGWYRIAVRLHEENEALIKAIKEVMN